MSKFSSYGPSNLLKPNTTMVYIIAKLDCLNSYITVCEWFISISETLPKEEDGCEKKPSMSYDTDDDLKSYGSSTFESISSFTTAVSLLDSTVETNVKLEDVQMNNDLNMTM